MAARFARALGDHPIVLPHYYGDAQIAILREEIPEMSGRIYLSRELGELFRPLLLDAGNGMSFSEFGALLARNDHPFSARAIENRCNTMLEEGIPAVSLDGKEHRRFRKDRSCGSDQYDVTDPGKFTAKLFLLHCQDVRPVWFGSGRR